MGGAQVYISWRVKTKVASNLRAPVFVGFHEALVGTFLVRQVIPTRPIRPL